MKHDYAAAKKEYLEAEKTCDCTCEWSENLKASITHALAMMQKLQEPSEGMKMAAYNAACYIDGKGNGQVMPITSVETLKAMLEQAEKEITND